jgi:hypothetical protein
MKFIVLALVCLWSHKSYSADNYDDGYCTYIGYGPISQQLTSSQAAMLEYANSLPLEEGQRYRQILNEKAKEIVESEFSDYRACNEYGDFEYFYKNIREGNAQENLDAVYKIFGYLREKLHKNKLARYTLTLGQMPTLKEDVLSESFYAIYDNWWNNFSAWSELMTFSRDCTGYATFQAALEGIAAKEGKTLEEVKDDVRKYHPLALEEHSD